MNSIFSIIFSSLTFVSIKKNHQFLCFDVNLFSSRIDLAKFSHSFNNIYINSLGFCMNTSKLRLNFYLIICINLVISKFNAHLYYD